MSNSTYGFCGSPSSPIPCLPVAMCITKMGRDTIERASNIFAEKYHGSLIYGDTDSNYIQFLNFKSIKNTQDYKNMVNFCTDAAAYVSNQFHVNLNIEFEEKIYAFFLIVKKKMYAYVVFNKDGTVNIKIFT
jgi:DNA polymerase elongation subunit (family B)